MVEKHPILETLSRKVVCVDVLLPRSLGSFEEYVDKKDDINQNYSKRHRLAGESADEYINRLNQMNNNKREEIGKYFYKAEVPFRVWYDPKDKDHHIKEEKDKNKLGNLVSSLLGPNESLRRMLVSQVLNTQDSPDSGYIDLLYSHGRTGGKDRPDDWYIGLQDSSLEYPIQAWLDTVKDNEDSKMIMITACNWGTSSLDESQYEQHRNERYYTQGFEPFQLDVCDIQVPVIYPGDSLFGVLEVSESFKTQVYIPPYYDLG